MAAIPLVSNTVERKRSTPVPSYKSFGRKRRPFTPEWLESTADRPIFFLRVAGKLERELFAAEISMRFNISDKNDPTWKAVAPVLAFMKFCVGWKNVRDIETRQLLSFAQNKIGLVDQACMARVDPLEIRAAGQRAYALMMAH